MNWQDDGFLLSKRKFRENANFVNFFCKKFGKTTGVIYGGNSRKIRNYLQISNKLFIIYTSKNENRVGYFKTEIINPISPKYFHDKKRAASLLALASILDSILPEGQPYEELYNQYDYLLNDYSSKNWFINYILFEFYIIKTLGFDPNLGELKYDNIKDEQFVSVEIDNINYQAPLFLINGIYPKKNDNNLIKRSLGFTRSIMQNKLFISNNLIFPKSRIIFENYFN